MYNKRKYISVFCVLLTLSVVFYHYFLSVMLPSRSIWASLRGRSAILSCLISFATFPVLSSRGPMPRLCKKE